MFFDDVRNALVIAYADDLNEEELNTKNSGPRI